jgi:hypothetical protein
MSAPARLLASAVLLAAASADAYTITAPTSRRPGGSYEFRSDLALAGNPTSPGGVSWDDAFEDATERWNAASPSVDLTVLKNVLEEPCEDDDDVHGVGFRADVCGSGFGAMTLAVARRKFTSGGLVTEGNIVFNSAIDWNVYDGPLQAARDFRRVAIHEIGHLLGLGHEDDVPAIMATLIDDLDAPTADDLAGIAAIYDLDCPVLAVGRAGVQAGTLGVTDCFDSEIGLVAAVVDPDPGVETHSFVDLYRVSLPAGGPLAADLASDDFNVLVQIVSEGLDTQLAADWNGPGSAASAAVVVAPGDYVVVVRSVLGGEGGHYALELAPEPGQAAASAAALAVLAALARRRRAPRS